MQQRLNRIVRHAARQFAAARAFAVLTDERRKRLLAGYRVDAAEAALYVRLGAVISSQSVHVVPDALSDGRLRHQPLVNTESGLRFFACAPLKSADGRTFGALCIADVNPRPELTNLEKDLLAELAAIAAETYELSLAETEGRRRHSVAEQQLDLIVENAPVEIAIVNRNMEYLTVSRKWREDFNLGDQNIIGRSHYDIFPEIPDAWKADHQRCLRGEVVKLGEEHFRGVDGTVNWVRRHMYPWYDGTGAVGGIVFINDFTTERKHDVAELERNRRFLSAVLHNVSDGIIACDEKGRFTIVNSEAERIVVADIKTIPLDQWARYFNVYDEDGETLLENKRLPLYRALQGETVRNQIIVVAPPGHRPRTCCANSQPLIGRGGTLMGAVVSFRDITKEREMEAQYRQAQKMEAVGQLTGGLAHDFNNLLAVILGNLQLLQGAVKGQEIHMRRVEAAISAAQRGADLTSRLLAFSRKQTLSPKPIDANSRISILEQLLSRTLGETIRLQTISQEGLWAIYTDDIQFEAALLNLAINARDAMPDGGDLTITTANISLDEAILSHQPAMEPGDYVRISVSDTGCGMSREVLARAFEPFFTTKDVGKGSGLGLSMVYGFIKQSEGHITIDSALGRGTTVSLYFPRSLETVSPDGGPSTGEREWKECQGTERLLVVEDDAEVRRTTVALLENMGYDVTEACSGQAALDILDTSEKQFDLLLTDIIMPGKIDGPALARIVNERFPDMSVLFATAYAQTAVLSEGGIRRADLITKPFRREDLARKLRNTLDSR